MYSLRPAQGLSIMSKTESRVTVTLLFDGTCGFCTRSVRYLKKWDKQNQVEAVPCQIAVHDPSYGLNEADCSKSIWVYTSDGRRASGAQAAMLIASVISGRTWPVTFGKLPVIRQALDFGYITIAKNRYRFPGDTPACQTPEFDCGAAAATSCRMPSLSQSH
jgi:predicted DCC family thiol-disulfide oxidoreductase YuxK